MRRSIAAVITAAALLWTGQAFAASCQSGAFNGLYAGVSGGYAYLRSRQDPSGEPRLSPTDGGGIIGGHLGYNIQCDRVVVGLEGDVSYVNASTNSIDSTSVTYRSDLDSFATLRGRLGFTVSNNTLIYVTGGAAWAKRTHALNDPFGPPASPGPFAQSDSDIATGWVVGGGIEFLRHERWLLRFETLYADLGSTNRRYTITGGTCGPCVADVRWRDEVIVARVGLSIKFGHRPTPEPYK